MKTRNRNLRLRGGIWYVEAVVRGKRISRSLGCAEKEIAVARARARAIVRAAREARWEALDATRARTVETWATIGDLLRVYRAEAVRHGLRTVTVRTYLSSLFLVLGDDREDRSAECLSRATVAEYVSRMLSAGDDDGRRRTIASTVRQARGLLSPWALEAYRAAGLRLPQSVEEFRRCYVVEAPPVRYRLPPAELRERTDAAGARLREERPELWPVWLLARYCGLRAGEIAAARGDWLEESEGRYWIRVGRGGGWAPKGQDGRVPVPGAVWAWLGELPRVSAWILDGTPSARRDRVNREFAAWMRGLGWDGGKAAHELRKWRGSEWMTARGLEAAAAWLRHSDVATTQRYYADWIRQPATLEVGYE